MRNAPKILRAAGVNFLLDTFHIYDIYYLKSNIGIRQRQMTIAYEDIER